MTSLHKYLRKLEVEFDLCECLICVFILISLIFKVNTMAGGVMGRGGFGKLSKNIFPCLLFSVHVFVIWLIYVCDVYFADVLYFSVSI